MAVINYLMTPSRFTRVNPSRSWKSSSPDAICFNIDRPGIFLVGVCVYGGSDNCEYTLELMYDVHVSI